MEIGISLGHAPSHPPSLYPWLRLRYRVVVVITSASNERIKHARRVREGREPGLLFVEGERLAEECVRSGLSIDACFHPPEPAERAAALIANLPPGAVFPASHSVLESLSDTAHTQGIILIAHRPERSLADAMTEGAPRVEQGQVQDSSGRTSRPARRAPLVVVLDRVQDPGNFGTLLRTAEAAGASAVIALTGCADAFAPKTLRSSMGSAFRLPVITGVAASDLAALCDEHGLALVAASGFGEMDYTGYYWRQPTALLLGNEARGVDPALEATCRHRLRIPLHPPVESLNVAAAGAALLFEAARQRREG